MNFHDNATPPRANEMSMWQFSKLAGVPLHERLRGQLWAILLYLVTFGRMRVRVKVKDKR